MGPLTNASEFWWTGKCGPISYTAVTGSTVITLNAKYLKTLSVDKHTLRALYTDSRAASIQRVFRQTVLIQKRMTLNTQPRYRGNLNSEKNKKGSVSDNYMDAFFYRFVWQKEGMHPMRPDLIYSA